MKGEKWKERQGMELGERKTSEGGGKSEKGKGREGRGRGTGGGNSDKT